MAIATSTLRVTLARLVVIMLAIATLGVVTAAPADAATPIAVEDRYGMPQSVGITVPAPGVMANDVAAAGLQVLLVDTSIWSGSSLEVRADGGFSFTPQEGTSGESSFTYCLVQPGSDACLTPNQTVYLYAGQPYVLLPSYVTPQDTPLVVSAAEGLLAGAGNIRPGIILRVDGSDEGTVTSAPDGSFVFDPDPGFIGSAKIGYCLVDEATPAACVSPYGTATVAVYPPVTDQSITATQNELYDGRLYPATSGDTRFVAMITAAPSHGVATTANDGSFQYQPATDYVGPDSFSFCVSQDGESCLAGASTATVSITVEAGEVTTSTSLVVTPSLNVGYGEQITLTAAVDPAVSEGSVTFEIDGATISCPEAPWADGAVSCILPDALEPGIYSVAATYGGAGVYQPSTSPVSTLVVRQVSVGPRYTGLTQATAGVPFLATAELVNSETGAGVGGELVTFDLDGDSCTATSAANGVAWCELTPTSSGAHTIAVVYGGSSRYLEGTDDAQIEVQPQATTVSYLGETEVAVGDAIVASGRASVAGGSTAPGPLTFELEGGSCVAPTAGVTCELPPISAVGTYTLLVSYAGDDVHAPASLEVDITIVPISTTTQLSAPETIPFTGAADLVATVEPATADGTLTFTVNGEPIPGCVDLDLAPIDDSQGAACTTTDLPVGPQQIGASYSGSATHTASSDYATIDVTAAPTSLVYTGATEPAVGETFELSGRLTNDVTGDPIPDVPVTMTWAASTCDVITDADGLAACDVTATAVSDSGEATLTFGGSDSFQAAETVASIEVVAAATATTVDAEPNGAYPAPITVTVSVSPTDGVGTVDIALDGEQVPGCELLPLTQDDSLWHATCEVPPTGAGEASITATFSGSDDYAPSSGSTVVELATTPTTLSGLGPDEMTVGDQVVVTAILGPDLDAPPMVTAGSGGSRSRPPIGVLPFDVTGPGGTVMDLSGLTIELSVGSASCVAETDSDGNASCALVPVAAGSAELQATFAGTSDLSAASASLLVEVASAAQPDPTPTDRADDEPELPGTGSDLVPALVALLCLLAGVGLVLGGRRRHRR